LKINLKWLLFDDVVEIQTAVTDELKKVQKRGIFGRFSETVRLRKSPYICQCSLFWLKKRYCLPHASSILKKSVLKLLDHTV
jgi:hypothetical protein